MPTPILKYKVFIASPSDVMDERQSINEVVDELNLTFSNQKGIVIEVIKWETHVSPAVGIGSVQKIINKDVGDDYDLFIGVLWKKFGTPTDVAESGTEEEFLNAYKAFIEGQRKLQILFYFNNSTPLSLSEIDPAQLAKVSDFKKQLAGKGVLYSQYNTIEEFQKFLRIHIQLRIGELMESHQNADLGIIQTKELAVTQIEKKNEVDEELGTLDYQELIEEYFANSTNSLVRMSDATSWVGKEISKKADELNELSATKVDLGKKFLKDFCRRTATLMNDYAARIESEIPIFISSFERGTESFTQLIAIYNTDFAGLNRNEAQEVLHSLNDLKLSVKGASDKMDGLLTSVTRLPRLEKELTKARNNVEYKLKELRNKLDFSCDLAEDMERTLQGSNLY